jgi:uncharacterized protein YndB with AHSA1/START domain
LSREATTSEDLVVERRVKASAADVFRFFSDRDRWMRWQGVDAEIDLRPGGVFRVNVTGDGFASGRFTEVVENRRVVFTWGWEGENSALPPGSSTVAIDLLEEGGGTLIRLTHSGLPPETIEVHRIGWENYGGRLAAVSEDRDPGPDPMISRATAEGEGNGGT